MTIYEKKVSENNLKISDWELDFYSRPIIEKNGKKRWELIIDKEKVMIEASERSLKTKSLFDKKDLEK